MGATAKAGKRRGSSPSRKSQIRRSRYRYGPEHEERRALHVERRSRENAAKLWDALRGETPEDHVMASLRFAEEVREWFRRLARERYIGGPKKLQAITRAVRERPEASLACKCHCEEPAGDGWADDE